MTKTPFDKEKARVFISYSRKDGADFAADLRERLIAEGLDLWQDRTNLEGGVDWWQQIVEALTHVEFMVLVATPKALASPIVRKEWRQARQEGVCVYPVQVPGKPIDFAAMPKWMRDSHFYDLDHEWETFVTYLKNPCTANRVPFMAPDLPEHFVERPEKFEHLKQQLRDADLENPVAITTALSGAGGFGKTTLAAALCHDEDIQTAFDDGVLWVTLGETPNIVNKLTVLFNALTDENPSFVEIEQGAVKLAEKLKDKDILLVIDDVWDSAHLRPFLRGGEQCARLVTTRFSDIAVSANAKPLDVDEMTEDESVTLLLKGIEPPPTELAPFAALADRLGNWALMLELTNAMLREETQAGSSLADALDFINELLDEEGVHAIEGSTSDERKQSAAGVLAASLRRLSDDERTHLCELSIFAEDNDIPLTSVQALWGTKGIAMTKRLVIRFARGSFLRFDRELNTIRLHDVVREVLAGRLDDAHTIHGRLIEKYGDLKALPDDYAWRNIAYHLHAMGKPDLLRELLLDIDFLQAKLNATDPNALIDDCTSFPNDVVVSLIKSSISISSHILTEYPDELPSQLYGRLFAHRNQHQDIAQLLRAILDHKELPAFLTKTRTLQCGGGPLLRTLDGNDWYVQAVAFKPDGHMAVSGSANGTVKLWDVITGHGIWTSTTQSDWVNAVACSPSGKSLALGLDSGGVQLWDIETGEEVRMFDIQDGMVLTVAFSPDSKTIVSGASSGAVILWDVYSGSELRKYLGHSAIVHGVAYSPDGKAIVSGADDGMIKLWDVEIGEEILAFETGLSSVSSVAYSPDGARILSGHFAGMIKFWDTRTGEEIRTINSHGGMVLAVAYSPDGKTVVSGDSSGSVTLWDVNSGKEIRCFAGHWNMVSAVAYSPDGNLVLSGSRDGTMKVWDLRMEDDLGTFAGHSSLVSSVAYSPDGKTVITGSHDRTLNLWDVETGEILHTFEGHKDSVNAVSFGPSGKTVLSASGSEPRRQNNTIVLWDIESGDVMRVFTGHENAVVSVAYSSDGKMMLSGSRDKTLKLWDLRTGSLLLSQENTPSKRVKIWNKYRVTFSPVLQEKALNVRLHSKTLQVIPNGSEISDLLLSVTLDATPCDATISARGIIVAGDEGGHVHILHPNPAARRLLGLDDTDT